MRVPKFESYNLPSPSDRTRPPIFSFRYVSCEKWQQNEDFFSLMSDRGMLPDTGFQNPPLLPMLVDDALWAAFFWVPIWLIARGIRVFKGWLSRKPAQPPALPPKHAEKRTSSPVPWEKAVHILEKAVNILAFTTVLAVGVLIIVSDLTFTSRSHSNRLATPTGQQDGNKNRGCRLAATICWLHKEAIYRIGNCWNPHRGFLTTAKQLLDGESMNLGIGRRSLQRFVQSLNQLPVPCSASPYSAWFIEDDGSKQKPNTAPATTTAS